MEKIIASGPLNEDATKHIYLGMWEGYSYEENTWELFQNVNENARELLEEYHVENLNMEKDKRFGKEKLTEKDAGGTEKKRSWKCKKL